MKYPRTFHLSFSPEIFSDDKVLSPEIEKSFINRELTITEKMDGGNSCLHKGKVFARTHAMEANHASFSKLKQLYNTIFYTKSFDFNRYMLFGENLQALHSIEYTKLNSPFCLFNVFDIEKDIWLSTDNVQNIAIDLELTYVPLITKKNFNSLKKLKSFLDNEISKPSFYGPNREGFVLRDSNEFKFKDFSKNVCKYVRKNHVQTDNHWTKDWKENVIL